MKYTVSVEIERPIDEVIQTLKSREASLEWMEGLKSFELIEGELGEIGSKYSMKFIQNNKEQVMIETLKEMTERRIVTVYEMGNVINTCDNRFYEINDKTVYKMETEFSFGKILNLFIWMLKPMFKKETLKGMVAFKDYCEKEKDN